MIIFTSICANYAHKARTLAKSVKDNIPDAKFIVCLLEKEIDPRVNFRYFDDIVLAKDAWEGNFSQFIFKHTIVEASTSVKGQFFRYLYKSFPLEEQFIYLDPDIYVYSDFVELRELLETRPIILCPHLLDSGNIDMELSSTAHGVYNLGFLAVNRSNEAKKFIDWWAERLYLFCYDDISNGIFTDQKWIDLAPCFFDVEIFKHRGYDFAPWSLLNSEMNRIGESIYVKEDLLRFIHYSGYGESIEKCIREWLPKDQTIFKELYSEYSTLHDENDHDHISQTPWSYANYESGEKINDTVRWSYRKDYELMFATNNPFSLSNQYFGGHVNANGNSGNLRVKLIKSKKIIREQGLKVFLKKVKNKILK